MTVATTAPPRTRPTTRATSGLTPPMLGRSTAGNARPTGIGRSEGAVFIWAWEAVHRTAGERHERGPTLGFDAQQEDEHARELLRGARGHPALPRRTGEHGGIADEHGHHGAPGRGRGAGGPGDRRRRADRRDAGEHRPALLHAAGPSAAGGDGPADARRGDP